MCTLPQTEHNWGIRMQALHGACQCVICLFYCQICLCMWNVQSFVLAHCSLYIPGAEGSALYLIIYPFQPLDVISGMERERELRFSYYIYPISISTQKDEVTLMKVFFISMDKLPYLPADTYSCNENRKFISCYVNMQTTVYYLA